MEHWDTFQLLADNFKELGVDLEDFISEMEDLPSAREELLDSLSRSRVYMEMVKAKILIHWGHHDWDDLVAEALENISNELFSEEKEKESFDTMEF